MRFLISFLVFAIGALSSPVENEKRVLYETVYNTVTYLTDVVVWVTTTPAVSVTTPVPDIYQVYEADLTTYRRHRHTLKNGSPKAASYGPTTITVGSLETSIQTETSSSASEVTTSEELVVTSEAVPSTSSSATPSVLATTSVPSTSSSATPSISASTSLPTATLTVLSTLTSATSSVSASTSLPIATLTVLSTLTSASSTSTSTSSSSVELTTSSVIPSPATSSTVVDATTAAFNLVQPPTTFVPNLDPASDVYKALVLQHHNVHRRNHSAPDLTWNAEIAGYAETTAKTCIWGHSLAPGGGGYGQNIAAGTPVGNISAILTNGFYNGELPHYPQYGTNTPDMTNFEQWGHFSQFVWHSTTSVGCYTEICTPPGTDSLSCKPDGTSYLKNLNCGNGGIPAIFTVCNYDPPGNYGGQYLNVHAPEGLRTIYVDGKGTEGL